MKKKTAAGLLRTAAGALCLGVCLWSAAGALKSWAANSPAPAETELFSRLPGEKAEGPAVFSVSATGARKRETEDGEEFIERDGILPFREEALPGAFATPEPGRNTGPVQEILIDGGTRVGDFFVRDTTDSGTELERELEETPDARLKCDGSIEVLIYHTHTSEAYVSSPADFYYTDMETRSGNRDRTVTAVGEQLKKALELRGIGVVHDVTVCDEIFNGSYSRSWEVIEKNLEEHPGIRVTVDIHRDSMTTREGVKYKPTAVIAGRKAAQIMVLAGCNADESWENFPDWRENLRLALRVQQKAQELYPGLARPLNFSNNKYNMNATTGSLLIEVGTEMNTVSEAKYAGKLLGGILAETFLDNRAED